MYISPPRTSSNNPASQLCLSQRLHHQREIHPIDSLHLDDELFFFGLPLRSYFKRTFCRHESRCNAPPTLRIRGVLEVAFLVANA